MTETTTVEAFLAAARAAGYPVLAAGAGPWPDPETCPGEPGVGACPAPNDVLDAAGEVARRRATWVHAVLPTLSDAVQLAAAVQPPHRPSTDPQQPAWRRLLRRPSGSGTAGDPRGVPFADLVAQMPLGVRTLTTFRDGRAVHVAEIPANWLDRPLVPATYEVTR